MCGIQTDVAGRRTDRCEIGSRRVRCPAPSRTSRIQNERWRRAAVDRFLGRMEQALLIMKAPEGDPAFASEVAEMRVRLDQRRAGLSDSSARDRQRAALARVSTTMARLLPSLDAERPKDRAELNIVDLTIRVTGGSGRSDEIGSGANWLSYHVAVMLGLHELFRSQKGNPVPSLLVLDQPSQVYFLRKLAKEPKEGGDPTLGDEDVAAVRNVFVTLAHATHSIEGLQVLVLDHATRDVWGDVDVYQVEEWRDGKALVPKEWLGS